MFSHSNTSRFFSVLTVVFIFSLFLEGVAAAQTNTSLGTNALFSNTTGINNTAIGFDALVSNATGSANTASGVNALASNITRGQNTAIGVPALALNRTGDNNTASGSRGTCGQVSPF